MCQKCVQLAIQKIASRCLYSKEAIIWYRECLVRYSSRSIFSNLEEWPRIKLGNFSTIPDTSNQGGVGWVLANTLNEAITEAADGVAAGEKKFATRTGKVRDQKVCTLVQCSHDLTSGDCRGCLRDMMADIPLCCLGRYAGMVLYPSCSLMFGLRLFYREVEAVRARSPERVSHDSVSVDGGKGGSASEGGRKVRSRIIIAVVIPVVITALLSYFVIYLLRRKARRRYAILKENFGTECTTLESLRFDFATIEAATNRFSDQNRIAQGGFGEVYEGTLSNGQKIAVKRLSTSSEQGTLEFKNEILLTAKLQHRNLVTLLGFCLQEHEKILVYKFAPNKSLDYFLFGLILKINSCQISPGALKSLKGLSSNFYLHEHSRLKIIHRDLKPSNIL
ncbi:cysteine-rich receptor-like protein kinase 10 [Neltuma alba]|uniref:cysteine-rich receptor-like protein kinase 10 n=1 Tax=Neltuma alba TaxID=207710 RepID=UPI0010A461BB|nr:cysteine-rich receptor-like protein kinase 10 [Prosopis alba]